MATITVQVDLPEEALRAGGLGTDDAATEMRRLFVLERFREGRISSGKAAELAGMSRAEFYRYMSRHGISPFQFDDMELRRELGPLQ